ncbi:hypothetical protein Csa_016994 [Cucumis sativus]|uniref:Uncharacterized protein n=1 Tax=Cucumis sativus TaxID=3659 RepID=A0A0A0KCG8_CUCSA|nr:hypothetical protein Csa_016994 [Cucumis sativus]
MKSTSIDAATVKKRALISLQRVYDIATIDRRSTTTATTGKDDLIITKKNRFDLGGDEPAHGDQLNENQSHDRVEKEPQSASMKGIGPKKNGSVNLMNIGDGFAGPVNSDELNLVKTGESNYGPNFKTECVVEKP